MLLATTFSHRLQLLTNELRQDRRGVCASVTCYLVNGLKRVGHTTLIKQNA
jgi:hypothetical protein